MATLGGMKSGGSNGFYCLVQGMQRRGHVQIHRAHPAAEVSVIPTVDVLKEGGLEEEWMNDAALTTSLHTWRMLHPADQSICIVSINTIEFQDPSQHLWDQPLSYDVANTYATIWYALRHGYDMMRVHMPPTDSLSRFVAWYKIPVLRYLLQEEYEYVLFIDADAYIVQSELTLQQAVPAFFQLPDKVALAPKDISTSMSAGTMVFRLTAPHLPAFLDSWWHKPDVNANHTDYSGYCKLFEWPAEQGCLEELHHETDWIEMGEEGWLIEQAESSPKFIRHVTGPSGPEVRLRKANYHAAQSLTEVIHALLSGSRP